MTGPTTTRRSALLSGAALAAAFAARANAQELRPIRFGVGLRAMSAIVINTVIGETLGYHKAEGFALSALALGTNANVQIAVDRGDVEFGIGTPSLQLPLLAQGQMPAAVDFYQYTYPYKWDVAVKPGSPIRSYADLKGKKVGVSDLGATDYPVTKTALRTIGVDPDAEVQWIAVGNGVPAGVALQRGAIDALAYFDTGFGQIEAAGMPLEMLPRPEKLPMVGGQFLQCRKSFLSSDRRLAVGFGRSVAKASYFILANPAAGAAAFLKMFPETAPRGSSEADAVKAIVASISRRIKLYEPPYAGAKIGSINPDELRQEAELNGFKIADLGQLYTNDLIAEINDFDVAKVRAEAAAYRA